jgi:hypothetical protein
MKTIWKYELERTGEQRVEVPRNAKLLCIKTQHGKPCIWFEVETESGTEERIFSIFGTGHEIPQDMGVSYEYIDSFLVADDNLVFHVYEYTGV